jgi:hypothetical protein
MYKAATSLAYLRMRGDVTFLTDGSIMTEVNTIQASSTFGSTHTQLLIKPENYCIIETHSFSMSTIFWDMTPCNTLKFTDILRNKLPPSSKSNQASSKHFACYLFGCSSILKMETPQKTVLIFTTVRTSNLTHLYDIVSLLTDTRNNVNVPVWNVVMHALK